MPTSQQLGGPATFGYSDHPDSSCRLPASCLDDSSHLAINTSLPLQNTGGGPPQPYNDLVAASSSGDEQPLRFSFQNDLVLPNSYQFASSAPENSIYPSTQPHLLNQSAGDHISDLSAAPMFLSSMQSSLRRLAPAPPKPTNAMSLSDGSILVGNCPQPSPVSVDHQTRGKVSLGGIPIRSKPIEHSPIVGGFTLQGRPTAGIV
ncbi:hypothetical protein BU24DRAFT_457675 [Aaosphaeria arxii CBS 175.79]|uniref:Uncharacterized protein n=1 Tax=Aaosphaeria arxii CBS 175.79 TaxID=1450172 RepID=A0A6A5Y816_9PLEO|nr:uncharacterized protein BU24DRAFT_457675 [Aaosphaeria arxii CBS 175.79]KAF2021722.1 hypothetical protein BU24DRAFT_457675 [Aaosphaeria arxii CBS 175.79]